MATELSKAARRCSVHLLGYAAKHKRWTPEQHQHFTRAYNALQRLAGKKFRVVKDKKLGFRSKVENRPGQ